MKTNGTAERNRATLDKTDQLIVQSLARLDGIALGISLGTVFAATIFIATITLIIKGGDVIGPNLVLLNQYFIGYEISVTGSLIGFLYGFAFGFLMGWLIAFLRNIIIAAYFHILKVRSSIAAVNDYIDNP